MKRTVLITAVMLLASVLAATVPGGCSRSDSANSAGSQPNTSGPAKVQLLLDWHPEPEFGGFYAAQQSGVFTRHGLDMEIKAGGEGAPTWQMVANAKTDFATTAADQVLIARAQGADIVAIFAVYQTFPQGIMVHRARDFSSIADVFNHSGILAAESDTWLSYLQNKYKQSKVTVTGYSGGIATFLAKPDYSQQCFITSEPILATRQEGDPQTFLIADEGYNPYTTIVITPGQTLRTKPQLVQAMIDACREGWQAYLDDPKPANQVMGGLNHDMDAQTFTDAANTQKPLIEPPQTAAAALGMMTADRWNTLAGQLVQLKVIDKAPPAGECFTNGK